MTQKKPYRLAWVFLAVAALYLILPLAAMIWASVTTPRGVFTLVAYSDVFNEPNFARTFWFSARSGLITIVISTLLVVPTVYWVHLRLPHVRPIIEFFTLVPLVIPAILLTFGLIRLFNGTPLTNSSDGLYVIMIGSYVILSFPFFYRAVDTGMSSINVRLLTEAAQSLGAGWWIILRYVIFPNILVAILNGSFITFAIALGEFTVSSLLSQPAFSPYMLDLSYRQADQATALAIVSFMLTWFGIIVISLLGRRRRSTSRA